MSPTFKVGRNDPCPCGRVKKYKKCCEGRVDWQRLYRDGVDPYRYLSIRGRNIAFVARITKILQFDSPEKTKFTDYKASFTDKAVREIHEAVLEIWPPDLDIKNVLKETSAEVSGLYIGDYDRTFILRGIIRHSIYANKILVVDPPQRRKARIP